MICLFIELAKFWILTGKVDKISLFRITFKQNFRTKGKYQKFCEILLLLFQSTTKRIVDCENFFTFQAEKKCGETVIYSNYILDRNSRQTRYYPVYKDNYTDDNWTYLINLGKIVRRIHLFARIARFRIK